MTRSRRSLAIALAGFVALGLPDGLLGVAWPSIRTEFGLPLAALGWLLVARTAGYLVGSSASGFLADRFGTAAVLMAGFGASAVALMGYAASPAVAVLLVASTVHGFGASSIDGGGNAYVALRHGPRVMNLLHASWGIGAAAGPAALTALLAAGSTWRLAYAAMVVVDVSLVAAVLATRRSWLAAGPPPAAASAGNGGAVPVPVVAGMLAMFFVCTGIEYSAGSWSYPFLVGRGLGTATTAGLAVSAYWVSLTAGRLLAAAAGGRLGARRLLDLGIAVVVLAVVPFGWAPVAPVAVAGLAGLGLGLAPVFPALVTLTPERVGRDAVRRVVGFQLAAGGSGGALVPAAIGPLLQEGGLALLGPCLLAGAALLVALHLVTAALSGSRRPEAGRAA